MTKLCGVLALALLLVPGAATADNGSLGPTVTGETGLFSLFSGETLPKGTWSFGLHYNNWDRLALEDSPPLLPVQPGEERDYEWHRIGATLGYGITDNFELSLLLPYDSIEDNGKAGGPVRVNDTFFSGDIDGDGLANARLGAKWNLFTSDDKRSHFGLNAFVEVPTGDEDEGVSTGDTGFGLGLAYDVKNWVLNLGFRDPGDADNASVPTEILAGIGYAARINDKFHWLTELSGTFYSDSDLKPDDDIDLTTGGRMWLGADENWAFNFALRTNLTHIGDTDEFCPLGGLIGVAFFPHLAREKAEAARLAAEEEARRLAAGEEARRQAAEEEARRKAAEEEARRKAAEEEARRKAAEEEARRKQQAPTPPPPPPVIEEVCQFAASSARVDNRCKATLDEVALRMKQEGQRIALVIGYTDAGGSESANQRISQRRAEAVKSYLVTRHGIDATRITTEGRGEADPVGDNATRAGRAQNRRAVIVLKVQ